ncbi:hypothetical protein ACOME3_002606 [Neoechinorhynchus agilis]
MPKPRFIILFFFSESINVLPIKNARQWCNSPQNETKLITIMREDAARRTIVATILYSVVSMVSVNLFGWIAKTYGVRRSLLGILIANCMVDIVRFMLAVIPSAEVAIQVLLLINVLDGATGGFVTINAACGAYLGISLRCGETKFASMPVFRFGIMDAFFFLAIVMGQITAGAAVDKILFERFLAAAFSSTTVSALYVAFILKDDKQIKGNKVSIESVDTCRSRKFSFKEFINNFKCMFRCGEQYRDNKHKQKRLALIIYLFIYSLATLANSVNHTIMLFITAFAKNKVWIYSTLALTSLSSFEIPAIKSQMLGLVEKSHLAILFGLLGCIYGLSYLMSTAVFQHIYIASLPIFPGLIFIVASFIIVLTFPLRYVFMLQIRLMDKVKLILVLVFN